MTSPTAIIAEDEPLLATTLRNTLETAWPDLQVLATAANGTEAVQMIDNLRPDIAFLDIQMPGLTGIEVAHAIAEDWEATSEYAIDAFESGGVDYVLKPVTDKRLGKTVERLQRTLGQRNPPGIQTLTDQLQHLLANAEPGRSSQDEKTPYLKVIRASVGDEVRMIPTEDIVLLESADKYVLVCTSEHETVIREPLKRLREQLDPNNFIQIHRGAIVNLRHVEAAVRDESGKLLLRLRGLDRQPVVSRVYRHLFQAM
jgi:DNA-binding LytR/AlgR family response regulator